MSEVGSGEFEATTKKEVQGKTFLLRDIYSNPINVQVPPEKKENVWDIGKRRPGTSPLKPQVEKMVSLATTSRLGSKSIVEVPVTPTFTKYFEVGEPIAQKDKLKFPNSIWLQEIPIKEDEFNSLTAAGRKTFALDSLPLSQNTKDNLGSLVKKVQTPPLEFKAAA